MLLKFRHRLLSFLAGSPGEGSETLTPERFCSRCNKLEVVVMPSVNQLSAWVREKLDRACPVRGKNVGREADVFEVQ